MKTPPERELVALLPCPFCGGEPALHDIGNSHTKSRSTAIWCTGCHFNKKVGAIVQSLDWTRAKAIEAWNTRAPTLPGAGGGDALDVFRDTKYRLADGTELHFHVNTTIGVNTWFNGEWIEFDEGSPDECAAALKASGAVLIDAAMTPPPANSEVSP